MSRSAKRGALLAAGLLALALLIVPARAIAQVVEAPAMAETPRLFRISATGGELSWDDASADAAAPDPHYADIEAGSLFGLEVESRVLPYVGFRLGGAYGVMDVVPNAAAGSDPAFGVNQYVVDLGVLGRAAFEPMRRIGVVPFATIGLGTVVHDPKGPDDANRITRSQGSWHYGAGIDVEIFGRLSGRFDWRHYSIQLQSVAEPADREGFEREADRWLLALSFAL